MPELEVRCEHCRRPGRTPTLLATLRAGVVLVPVRIPARLAREGGVARTGMFWRKAAMDGSVALLRCRRCKILTRYDASRAAMAEDARSDARPSQAR